MTAPGSLPLAEFVASLSDLGIRATLDDQRRIALAVRAGGPWTVLQLRGVLSSLLVRDRDKLAEFRRRFDSFFDLSLKEPSLLVDVERALAELRGLDGQPKSREKHRSPRPDPRNAEQASPRPWRWSVLAAAFALFLLQLQESTPSSPRGAEVLAESSTTTRTASPDGAQGTGAPAQTEASKKLQVPSSSQSVPVSVDQELYTYPHSPVLKVKAFQAPPAPPLWADPWFLASAALGYAVWLGRWLGSLARAPAPSDLPGGGPRLFRSGLVGGGLAPRLDRQTLDRVADSLGYFRSEESGKDLDPQASVERTVRNGGMPTPVFQLRRQMRRVLILEDLHAEARDWNPIARELSDGLSQRGVPVLHGLFAGIPDRFRSPDGLEQRIEDLEDERRGYLVLIFSDGKGLGPVAADFALERLACWPQVAWMQLQDRRLWDQTAARPALHGLPVFPADRKGLLQVVAAFAMERAVREPTSSPESWRGRAPRPLEGSLKLYVEGILGDSLLWAQACAMAPPPISLGLADRLRERFHPGLPSDRIERLIAVLPGSRLIAGGLKFDQSVLAVLREGFAQQHGNQEAVLEFLMEQMGKAEPEDRDSLAHQAWEWRLERIRLELDPEPAVERLAALAVGPMRETIRADLGKVWSRRPGEGGLPLRIRPSSRYAAERLAALTEGREISAQDLYRPRIWPEAGLAVAAVALVALLLWRLSLPVPKAVSLLLTRNTPDLTGTALVGIERRQGNGWMTVTDLTLDQDEIRSPLSIDPGEYLISAFLPGGGLTRKSLKASGPGTFTVELATESRTRPCRERFPDLGFVVTRCKNASPRFHLSLGTYDPSHQVYITSEGFKLLRRNGGVARIGIEFLPDGPSNLGDLLLDLEFIDVLYTVTVPEPQRAATVARIQQTWQPWAHQVRLLSWTKKDSQPLFSEGFLDWPSPPFPPSSIPAPSEPKLSGAAGGGSGTVASDTAPAQEPDLIAELGGGETAPIGSPAGDKPPASEIVQPVPQNLAESRETPPPTDQSPSCPGPGLSRCGDACVDLKTNLLHFGDCFTIAPILSRAAAENSYSPPSLIDEKIQIRRYYRLYYLWNESKDAIVVRSLPVSNAWDLGKAPNTIEFTLSAEEFARMGYVTDLDVHCFGSKLLVKYNVMGRLGRALVEDLNWEELNDSLRKILDPALSNWDCSEH